MLVGPHATRAQIEAFAAKLRAAPAKFIAQPTLALSTCPTMTAAGIAPRHVDLRPFILTGSDGVRIVPGGLTRVALKEGSLVVNSSQGGGTKDTWVIDEAPVSQWQGGGMQSQVLGSMRQSQGSVDEPAATAEQQARGGSNA
jgi:uncharacterized circularly permuted ATP-grasp superfamily protein